MDAYPHTRINIIAQFTLDLLLIKYWELVLTWQSVADYININEPNGIDAHINR